MSRLNRNNVLARIAVVVVGRVVVLTVLSLLSQTQVTSLKPNSKDEERISPRIPVNLVNLIEVLVPSGLRIGILGPRGLKRVLDGQTDPKEVQEGNGHLGHLSRLTLMRPAR